MIDQNLIELWQSMYEPNTLIHFLASADFRHEDWGNLSYIMDTAFTAGMRVKDLTMQEVGHDANTGHFVGNGLRRRFMGEREVTYTKLFVKVELILRKISLKEAIEFLIMINGVICIKSGIICQL